MILALAKFLSGFADYVYDVGIVIYLYDKTGSVAVIGGFFVSQFLPAFIMMVTGGIIDKYNKKMLMIISNFIKGAIFCVLLSNKSIWAIYLITFFINLMLEFERSTYSALMVDVFSKEEIFKMSSIINVVDSASLIMGPVCASFLATKFDISMNLMIDIVLYVMAALIFSLVKTNCLQETKQSTEIKRRAYI